MKNFKLSKVIGTLFTSIPATISIFIIGWVISFIIFKPLNLISNDNFFSYQLFVEEHIVDIGNIYMVVLFHNLFALLTGFNLARKISRIFNPKPQNAGAVKDEYYGIDKKLDKKLKEIEKLTKMFEKYILKTLSPTEILYGKSNKLLLEFHDYFIMNIQDIEKNSTLLNENKKMHYKEKNLIREEINTSYYQIDEKMSDLRNLIRNYDSGRKDLESKKRNLDNELDSIQKVFEKVNNLD